MTIDKMKLFESTRERSSPTFQITPIDGVPSFEAEPDLAVEYELIDASCAPTAEWRPNDNWTLLASWAFHQALWSLAEDGTIERRIRREDVTFERFDQWLRSNLADENWAEERREYEDSP